MNVINISKVHGSCHQSMETIRFITPVMSDMSDPDQASSKGSDFKTGLHISSHPATIIHNHHFGYHSRQHISHLLIQPTHNYMLPTGGIAVPLFLVLLTYASICSSHDSGNTDNRQQRDSPNLLPLPVTATAAALRPPQSQFQCLDGNCTPQNGSTPTSACIHPPFNTDDDSAHSPDADGGSTPTPTPTPFPFIALILGSLALLWVWAIDEAMILRLQFRVRSGTLDETDIGREKGGCRCRVCTLRMQARGQPLHDVKDNMA